MSFKQKKGLSLTEITKKEDAEKIELTDVRDLFLRFEEDANPNDTTTANSIYGNSFMFCDPENVSTIKKEDFLKFLPKMTEQYRKNGFIEKKMKSIEAAWLDNSYIIARAVWSMFFKNDGKKKILENISATYILNRDELNQVRIILQLDHQNLNDLIFN